MDGQLFSSGTKDIDNLILSYLKFDGLGVAFLINSCTKSLLSQPLFWIDLIREMYPNFVIPQQINYLECVELYRILLTKDGVLLLDYALKNQHSDMVNWMIKNMDYLFTKSYEIELVENAVKNEYVSIIEWAAKNNKSIFANGANLLCKYGKLDALKSLKYTRPEAIGLTLAITNAHHDLFYWIIENWRIYPDFEYLIMLGELEILKNLYKSFTKQIDASVNSAAIHGKQNILDWFAERNILPDSRGMNITAGCGHLSILKWGRKRKIYATQEGCNFAIQHKHISVAKWLMKKNINPNENAFIDLIAQGDVEMIRSLIAIKLVPTGFHFKKAIEADNLDIINLFLQQGIKPDNDGVDIAIRNGNLALLELFAEHGILTDSDGANIAVKCEHHEILSWLKSCKILPNTEGANNIYLCKNYDIMLQWLDKQNILPDTNGANNVASSGNVILLKKLREHNILPDNGGVRAAIDKLHYDCIKYLIEDDKELFMQNMTNEYYMTNIQLLITSSKDEQEKVLPILRLFIDNGIPFSQKDINHVLCCKEPIVRLILSNNLLPEITFIKEYYQRIKPNILSILKEYNLC